MDMVNSRKRGEDLSSYTRLKPANSLKTFDCFGGRAVRSVATCYGVHFIADDSPVSRKTLRQTPEREDAWEVCGEAADGREAIEKAQRLKPDVVVLDLSMPLMNGLDAARELKRLLPSLPLVMFTNFNMPELTNEALSAGVRAVVSKSEPAGLVSEIQALLEPAS
jgi:DNA-binding NarL/FixJ family response regulator